ncbi:MAG: hypothetical protein AB7S75_16345 [Desulfococcaceae bacterium]
MKFLVGDSENIDWSNDFILNLLHREIIKDKNFQNALDMLVKNIQNFDGNGNEKDRRKILNKILYYQSDSNLIRCGDIIQWQLGNNEYKFGIVVTPDCDLEQKNTRFLELIELRKFDDNRLVLNSKSRTQVKEYNHPAFHLFPEISEYLDLVAILKSKVVLEHISEGQEKYPKAQKRLEYIDKFLFYGQAVRIMPLCSLDNPYKSDFLQKLHSHNSRVGIPDIRNLI